ncbi:hypothetical protein GCM10020295_45900 [Streptomyces cinereospinus]
MGQQCSAQEGDSGPPGDEDAQPGRDIADVEKAGGGDVGAERRGECDDEPAPGRRSGGTGSQSTPRGDEQQVDGDGVGPRLPAVLPGRHGDVVQVGEGQRGGDKRLDEHRVDAGQLGAHDAAPFRVQAWEV